MTIIAFIITFLLDQWLIKPRQFYYKRLNGYIQYFSNKSFAKERVIRYAYLFACLPIVVVMLVIGALLYRSWVLYSLFTIVIFMFNIDINSWRRQAKQQIANTSYQGTGCLENQRNSNFISAFAHNFFVPLVWFFLLPTGVAAICYLVIVGLSAQLKQKGLDLVVYNVVVDKMLFYANVLPYVILYLFIAMAGNFEGVLHHILEKRKQINKSFYFLDSTLYEVVMLAIDKDKFAVNRIKEGSNDTEAGVIEVERFSPQITTYIVAILYRSSLFLLATLAIIEVATYF